MAEDALLPGMVDTTQYKATGPWLAGRAGLGDTNAWMTMFGLHFRYGIEEKYASFFKEFQVTSCFWNPVQQIADIESLVARNVDILFVDPASEAALVGAVAAHAVTDAAKKPRNAKPLIALPPWRRRCGSPGRG